MTVTVSLAQPFAVTLGGTQVPVRLVAKGDTGLKGDPGGNVMSVGTYDDLDGVTVNAGTDLVQTTGYTTDGIGAGLYVADALADAGLASSYPLFCKADAAGRYFRLYPTNARVIAEQSGVLGAGVLNEGPALQSALDYMAEVGGASELFCSPSATYGVSRPILLNDGQSLRLNGATIKMLSGFATVSGVNACVGATGKADIAVFGPGTVDANKVGLGGGDPARKNGVMFTNCERFLVEDVIGQNCTGYIFYPTESDYGAFRRCLGRNGQYHFEQQGCTDVLVEDCWSEPGDGTISCSAWLHPVFASGAPCKRITYRRFRAVGTAAAGCAVQGSNLAAAQEDIHLEECYLEVTAAVPALTVVGVNGNKNLTAERCTFITTGYEAAANVTLLTGARFDKCKFSGSGATIAYQQSEIDFVDCEIVGNAPNSGVTAFGILNGNSALASRVSVVRGRINMSAAPGPKVPAGGTGIRITRETVFTGISEDGLVDVPGSNNYWLAVFDQNRTIDLTWAGNAQAVRVYPDASNQLPPGAKVFVRASSTGAKTIAVDGAVTFLPTVGTSSLATLKANGTAVLEKAKAADTWLISGDLV